MNSESPSDLSAARPGQTEPIKSPRRVDPILQELYALKARLNREAGYSVEKILERVKQSAALPRQ